MRTVAPTNSGFTLVEIMVVVVIIGVLAGIAIPMVAKVRQNALGARFANDLRAARGMIEQYALEKGAWPPDGNAGMPAELADYLPPSKWSGAPAIGGSWDWDRGVFGFTAGLSVENYTVPQALLAAIDRSIDDGNLATGAFRTTGANRVSMILAP